MPLIKVNNLQRKALAIATVIAILAGFWFLRNYLMLIILSAVVVILFNPVYKWLLRKGRKPGTAATLTLFASFLAVVIPVTVVILLTVFQINQLIKAVSDGSINLDFTELARSIIDAANDLLVKVGSDYVITTDKITEAFTSFVENFGKTILDNILSSISGVFAFITTAIIYIYVFMSMLIHQDKIIDTAKKLNPLGDQISNLYFSRMGNMTKATVRGQFIIAFCQGTVSAIGLAIAGLNELFFFMWMLLTVLSIVPLGAGIVTIPIGIAMILTGNIWQGIFVILNHLIVVTNIDNILRPKLVPRDAKLDSALMILAVFAGIGLFGFFGIVIGPVLMIVLITTIQIFLEVFKNTEAIEIVDSEKSPKKHRFKTFFRGKEPS